MAPNQRSLLLYENDDLERVSVYEKKGKQAVCWLTRRRHRDPAERILLFLTSHLPTICTLWFFHNHLLLSFIFRVPNGSNSIRQWNSCSSWLGLQGSVQSDPLVVPSWRYASDRIQVGMRRRRVWRLHCHVSYILWNYVLTASCQ